MAHGRSLEMRYAGARTKAETPRETRPRDRSLRGKARRKARQGR